MRRLCRAAVGAQLREAAAGGTRLQRRAASAQPAQECVLVRHPGPSNAVTADCFAVRDCPAPAAPLDKGAVLCDTLMLSVDPYMRCMLDPDHPQLGEYLQPFALGQPLSGGGVGRVVASDDGRFREGDVVCAPFLGWPWRTRVALPAGDEDLALSPVPDPRSPSLALGYLGMPGVTAYFCMLDRGDPQPGQTVVISGAAGACGTLAGQLAKWRGAKVVGICGGPAKCKYLMDNLGFDSAIDYKAPGLADRLRGACPSGVDVYYDNVGGSVSDAVLVLMNQGGKVPICGQIARYDDTTPYLKLVSPEGISPRLRALLEARGVQRGRFLVLDYRDRWAEGMAHIARLMAEGVVRAPETVTPGFRPGDAFVGMMGGANIGKAVVDLTMTGAGSAFQRLL
eukprot:TRINITY_DN40222_c0_g1_i1.p1 TRINITY_DN40222_c0_g1~~TRINITY_DN40222_c0_g1_i1.p1  ORF type:complete len:423 (+),score=68.66 TRINITY_DN40222_c0_g1_i1:82-1269(+)